MSKEESKPDIIKFMLGEDEFDGLWFGDIKTGSPFWWRKPLRNYRDSIETELSELRKENDKISIELITGLQVQVNQKIKIEDLESQLSKAKELLREANDYTPYADLIKIRIESFLKS